LTQLPVPVSILQRPGNTYTTSAGVSSTSHQPRPPSVRSQSHQQPQTQPQPQPHEQIIYVATGHPLIIVDERRNPNTPLPTVIRDGKVVLGDARSIENVKSSNRAVVRSEHITSIYQDGAGTVVQAPNPQIQSVTHQQDASHTDSKLKRGGTWGHSRPKDPPFLHPPRRARSNSHGMKNIWLGWLTGAQERMEPWSRRERGSQARKSDREGDTQTRLQE